MIDIKFRGKRADNGEWVYGYYCERQNNRGEIIESVIFEDAYEQIFNGRKLICSELKYECHRVIPETVGQYTGLKDKNGKEIYDGDIVIYPDSNIFNHDEIVNRGYVDYDEESMSYYFTNRETVEMDEIDISTDVEVIGNIYENSELLE